MRFFLPGQTEMCLAFVTLIGGAAVIHRVLCHVRTLPDVPFYLIWGIVLGPVLGFIRVPFDSSFTVNMLPVAAGVILFAGGAHLPLDGLRRMRMSITLLATLGVLIASIVVALFIHGIWNLSWAFAWMCAIAIANTDPASVIPILSQLSVPGPIRITMEAESAFNDTMSAVMTSILMAALVSHGSFAMVFEQSARQILLGLMVGLAMGYAAGAISPRSRMLSTALVMTTAIIPYLLALYIGSNGYVASFTAGLSWQFRQHSPSNVGISHLSTVARIAIFSWLGLIMPIGIFRTYWPLAVGTSLVLMFAARPLTVLGSLGWIRGWSIQEKLFMMWIRETGAISAVLAIQVGTHFPAWKPSILAIVFSSIFFTVGIQAPSTGIVLRVLGLVSSQKEKIPESGKQSTRT